MKEKKKLIVLVDASALKESACGLRLFNNIVIGYSEGIQNNDVEFGTAFHKFKYHYRKGDTYGVALAHALKYYTETKMRIKTNKKYLDNMFLMDACAGYESTYKNDSFKLVIHEGVPLIELPFCFPYYVDEYMEILMAGTMDEIGFFEKDNIYSVEDIKTTSMWNIDEHLESFKLSPQLYFYRWAIKQYAKAYPDSIFGKIDKETVGCHISGVFYKGKDKPIEYKRSNVMLFKDKTLEEFETLLHGKMEILIRDIRVYIEDGLTPLREGLLNGACSTVFGPCKYAVACKSGDKFTYQSVLDQLFTVRHYNPLNFGGNKL